MRRRSLLAARRPLFAPAFARAQAPPLVGVMWVNCPSAEGFIGGFRRDMARLGWEDGRNYRTQVLFADGDSTRLPAMAEALVKAGAQVLMPFGNPAVQATQKTTREIPIAAMADDLAGSGLVASMARPGTRPASASWASSSTPSGSRC